MRIREPLLLAFGLALIATDALQASENAKVLIRSTEDYIDFLSGKELVTRYNKGPNVAKPYFWPVLAPGKVPLTRAWPMEKGHPGESVDHPHQKSIWFCHGDVIPEGLELKNQARGIKGIDFWAEGKGTGRIVCTAVEKPTFKDSHGSILTRNEWRLPAGEKILNEIRVLHFYDRGEARLLVVDVDLHAIEFPVTFGDTKEGSFGIRINDAIRERVGKGTLENANGQKTEARCWGQLAPWCDYSGPIDGKVVGLAIFDDPTNPYPAYWHSRWYGLMAANPFGRNKSGFPAAKGKNDLVRMEKGAHLKLRYGVLLHSGDAHEGKVAEHFQFFVKHKAEF